MRIAIYARISTTKQHAGNQLLQLREYCARMGFVITREFVDVESGGRGPAERVQLRALLEAAAAREFDRVIVWALDRLTREGPLAALTYLERLKANGIEFWSATEELFRTAGPFGELVIAFMAWFAKHERLRLVQRIRAGQDRAAAEGRYPGRRARVVDMLRLRALRDKGLSFSQISRETGVSKATVQRRLTA